MSRRGSIGFVLRLSVGLALFAGASASAAGGAIAAPRGTGLGVRLDREKLNAYHELYRRLGSYPYDQDPLRPGWTPTIPNGRWADPSDARRPTNIRF